MKRDEAAQLAYRLAGLQRALQDYAGITGQDVHRQLTAIRLTAVVVAEFVEGSSIMEARTFLTRSGIGHKSLSDDERFDPNRAMMERENELHRLAEAEAALQSKPKKEGSDIVRPPNRHEETLALRRAHDRLWKGTDIWKSAS